MRQELANKSFIDFIQLTKPDYEAKWFHILLADKLQKVYTGEIKRLIVSMPPQRGKSQIVSRHFPAWILGKDPKAKVIVASYSPTLASGFNRDTQRIISEPQYQQLFPNTRLNSSNVVTVSNNWLRNSDIFEVVNFGGFYRSVSVGGGLTGTPGDIAIIDDPVKDALEAESYTYRERVWKWYTDVLQTRLHNNSKIIICMTRWHSDDLVGRVLSGSEKDKWTVLHIPAIKENDNNPEDPREIGEGLWEEKFSLESVRAIQRESPRTFAALYQQNPRPVEVGGEAYYGFKTDKHVVNVAYKSTLPLHITWDFNRFPYTTCLVWQFETVDGVNEARQIDEICLPDPARTKGTCERFLSRYFNGLGHKSGLYIYGDPSGRNEGTTTEAGMNNYTLINQYLKDMHPQMRVATTQPSVDMRINWINDVLENNYGNIKVMIDPRCSYTIEDFQYIKMHPKGGKLKETGMIAGVDRPCEIRGHTSDADDYILCEVFKSEYLRFQRGSAPSTPTTGKNYSKNSYS